VCVRHPSSLVYTFYSRSTHPSTPLTRTREPSDRARDQLGDEVSPDKITPELNFRSSQQINTLGLVFIRAPCIDDEPPTIPFMDRNELRLSPLALSQDALENAGITTYEEWLISTKRSTSCDDAVRDTSSPTDGIVARLEEEFRRLQLRKVSEWKRQQELARCKESIGTLKATISKPDHCVVVDTSKSITFICLLSLMAVQASFLSRHSFSVHHAIFACYILVATLHLLCGLSVDDCSFLLPCVELIVGLSSDYITSKERLLKAFPRDIRTVKKVLRLAPVVTPFVTCPRCFALYPQDKDVPDTCSYRETASSEPCSEALVTFKRTGDQTRTIFVREYLHQSLKSWFGTLICRPGMESLLDRDVLTEGQKSTVSDIFGGTVLQEFLGPDGLPFLPSRGSEGRYVFGLSVDAFNPFLNKQAGKKASSTAIYMVCLNLPSSVRYKPENMYLAGIIPGPREPSLTQINHLLEPLVEELLEFWTPGIWFTRTPQWEHGRLARAALVPLICDLKAARQVMGHGSHSARKFCSICQLPRDEINVTDNDNLVAISSAEYKRRAMKWKNAGSQSLRDKIFKEYGVRWSVLLRLPYWDPPRFTVIDTMHTVLLGHLHRHCSILWKMNPTISSGPGRHPHPSSGKPQGEGLSNKAIMSIALDIRSAPEKIIRGKRKTHLWHFCLANGIVTGGSMESYGEKELQEKVLEYVSTFSLNETRVLNFL